MPAPDSCCPGSQWIGVADLGHAAGIDCALVRCSACGRSWVHQWTPFASNGGYSPMDDASARELAEMPAGPERKRRLRELLDL